MRSILFSDFAVRAYIAASAVGLTAPAIGTFLVQRRLSLIGDGVGHLAFAGVALGLLFHLTPLWGALLVALAGVVGLERLRASGRLSGDLSMALVFYFGVSLGAVVLSGLNRFDASAIGILFGSVFTVSSSDLAVMLALCAVVLVGVVVVYKELLAVSLDEETAQAAGLPVEALNMLTVALTALLVVAGMRAVGLLLIAALLVVPVASGSRIAHAFRASMLTAMALGVASAVIGLMAALVQGRIAPGGCIVLAALAAVGLAVAFGRRAFGRHPGRLAR